MNKPEPKHFVAEKKIKEYIKQCSIDEKIPGERVFAQQLGVSYMTARKAVDNLVAKGLLYKVPKKGTYVAGLKTTAKKTKNIGYFLDSSIKQGLSSPYYSLIFDAIEKETTKKGYSLIYFSDASENGLHNTMKKLDGIIVSCFPRIEKVVKTLNMNVPVVCIDNRPSDKSVPSITIDNTRAVTDAINYLCSLGHISIGFVTGLDDSDVGIDRYKGYLNALDSHGISEDTELVYKGDYSFKTGSDAADYFLALSNPPTAMMCANDTMAIGAIKEIKRRGLRVPNDISIIGFDDISIASHMTPALTTIAAPADRIAEHSVSILDHLINGTEPDDRHVVIPARLIERSTCMQNERPPMKKSRTR